MIDSFNNVFISSVKERICINAVPPLPQLPGQRHRLKNATGSKNTKGMKEEMKLNFKRFLSLALALMLLIGLVPVGSVHAEESAPSKPTATITDAEREGAAFSVNFTADAMTPEQQNYYGNWTVDLVLTANRALTMNHTNQAECSYLSINCPAMGFNWTNMPGTQEQNVEIPANTGFPLLKSGGKTVTYNQFDAVGGVGYAVYFPESYLEANPGLKATVALVLTNPENGETITVASYDYATPVPEAPTAKISRIFEENLTFAMNFTAEDVTDEQLAYYGDWYADFVLTVNTDVTFDANGTGDGWLSGRYDAWNNGNWVNVPTEPVKVKAGESLRIMELAAKLMNKDSLKFTYKEVLAQVKNFDCGVFFTEEFLEANPNLEVSLQLQMYHPEYKDEIIEVSEEYTFDQSHIMPELPGATIKEFIDDELTFAMSFTAEEVTDEQLSYYGDWYADFVLTVNKDVTFNAADESSDGWLSGRYEEWNNGAWVNVPTSEVKVKAGESLRIMKLAAELMNNENLQFTYKEVLEKVKNFDCGVFFTDAFLEANPDLKVSLQLKMFHPTDKDKSYAVGNSVTFTVEDIKPALPTATVSKASNPDLTFAMNFKADEVTDEQLEYYGNWLADFELTINKDVTFDANGTADGWLSGSYEGWQNGAWVNVPFNEPVDLKAGETIKIMAFAAELMGEPGLNYTYKEIYESVKDFDCGIYFTPEFLAANPDLEVTLQLRMYNPKDETQSYAVSEKYVFNLKTPAIPTATVTEIVNKDLTFALNFKANEVTPEQLEHYKMWYADFELTINKRVTFDATDEEADGYLSGSYDEWQNGAWVNVPFNGPVTLEPGVTLKIMEFAAKTMNNDDLKVTYKDIYETVKDFDCGVYFTPEFLAANPDLEVTLELRMYNPDNSGETYVIGETYYFKAYAAQNTRTEVKYNTVQAALDAAKNGDTVIALRNSEEESLTLFNGVTLDLNGKTVTATHVSAFQGNYIIDSTNGSGLLKVGKGYVVLQKNNPYLPIYNGTDGYVFTSVVKFQQKDNKPAEDVVKYMFLPQMNPDIHDLLAAGSATSGVELKVEVSWIRSDGKMATQTFAYTDDMVQQVVSSYENGRYALAYTLDLYGVPKGKALTFRVIYTSTTGAVVACAETTN